MRRQIIVLCLLAGVLVGCNSTRPAPPPCEPEIVPKPYPVLLYVGVLIPLLPALELPAYPSPPRTGASEEDYKDYAHRVGEVTKERAALRAARIKALESQIEANNAYAKEHPAPEATPTPPPE